MSALLPRTVDHVNITSQALDILTDGEMRSLETKMGREFYFVASNPTGEKRPGGRPLCFPRFCGPSSRIHRTHWKSWVL